MTKAGEQPTIAQADRDAPILSDPLMEPVDAQIWRTIVWFAGVCSLADIAKFKELMAEKPIALDTRTTSLAAQDGLAMYLLECVYSEVRLEGKLHEDIRDFLYEGKNPLPAMSDVVKALEPFVDLKHQKSAWAIIEKSASDFEPVTLTVTKRQMLDLLSAIKGDK